MHTVTTKIVKIGCLYPWFALLCSNASAFDTNDVPVTLDALVGKWQIVKVIEKDSEREPTDTETISFDSVYGSGTFLTWYNGVPGNSPMDNMPFVYTLSASMLRTDYLMALGGENDLQIQRFSINYDARLNGNVLKLKVLDSRRESDQGMETNFVDRMLILQRQETNHTTGVKYW